MGLPLPLPHKDAHSTSCHQGQPGCVASSSSRGGVAVLPPPPSPIRFPGPQDGVPMIVNGEIVRGARLAEARASLRQRYGGGGGGGGPPLGRAGDAGADDDDGEDGERVVHSWARQKFSDPWVRSVTVVECRVGARRGWLVGWKGGGGGGQLRIPRVRRRGRSDTHWPRPVVDCGVYFWHFVGAYGSGRGWWFGGAGDGGGGGGRADARALTATFPGTSDLLHLRPLTHVQCPRPRCCDAPLATRPGSSWVCGGQWLGRWAASGSSGSFSPLCIWWVTCPPPRSHTLAPAHSP